MFSIIDRKSKVDPLSGEGIKIDGLKGEIKLRNVHFAYPSRPDAPVLHGLDLDIAPGKITALVGASGSGKSTIFGLLERWYWKAGGTITLDGQPIESLDLRWLRNSMRLVQQVCSSHHALDDTNILTPTGTYPLHRNNIPKRRRRSHRYRRSQSS